MAEDSGAERTLDASDHRREEFRKQGRYARARDIGGLAATGGALLTLVAERQGIARAAMQLYIRTLGDLSAADRVGFLRVAAEVCIPTVMQALPVLTAAAVCGFLASYAQAGFQPNTDALEPKFERLDPSDGIARIFGFKKAFAELAMSLVRVGLVGYVAYRAVAAEVPVLLTAARAPLAAGARVAFTSVSNVITAVLVALFVSAAVDYAQSKFSIERELKMTRQEKMDEAKQQEGDPKAKGRMRARARANARKRAAASVKGADVIVTNPTHISVALRYGPKDPAPVVIAKGHDEAAFKIRREARKHGIPILENRPLARALDAQVAVGKPIPPQFFAAVAQVLAFVYRLKRRGKL
jgi:flagellar biosynthetic protein FlhB